MAGKASELDRNFFLETYPADYREDQLVEVEDSRATLPRKYHVK